MSQYFSADWRSLTQELQPQLSHAQGKAAFCLSVFLLAGQGDHEQDPATPAGCSNTPSLAAVCGSPCKDSECGGEVFGARLSQIFRFTRPHSSSPKFSVWGTAALWLGAVLARKHPGLANECFPSDGCAALPQTLRWGQLLCWEQLLVGNRGRKGWSHTLAWLLLWLLSLAQCQQLQHCWSTAGPGTASEAAPLTDFATSS